MVNSEMCRLCLESDENKTLFPLDLKMSILEMGNGGKVTVADALKYIELEVLIPVKKPNPDENENSDDEQQPLADSEKSSDDESDHPELPKSLCQECLDKLQSIYEFKYRVLENREYLKSYIQELAEAKLAEERAARQAIEQELDIDLNNLDSLPDKLVLKSQDKKTRKPRKQREPTDPAKPRQKRRMPDKSIIIAEDSQVDTAVYVRKLITTPEKTLELNHSSKRKSKHVVIEDIAVGEKPKPPSYSRIVRKKEPLCDENNPNESNNSEVDAAEASEIKSENVNPKKALTIRDEEPIFEDEEEEEEQKRPKRARK